MLVMFTITTSSLSIWAAKINFSSSVMRIFVHHPPSGIDVIFEGLSGFLKSIIEIPRYLFFKILFILFNLKVNLIL